MHAIVFPNMLTQKYLEKKSLSPLKSFVFYAQASNHLPLPYLTITTNKINVCHEVPDLNMFITF